MIVYKGKGVSSGMSIGKIHCFQPSNRQNPIKRYRVEDTDREVERFAQARECALTQLEELYEKALHEVGQTHAEIFEIHRMMLQDQDFTESIEQCIVSQGINAEAAVAKTEDHFALMFSSMEDAYLRERASDVHDIAARLLEILNPPSKMDSPAVEKGEKIILFAQDLTPSETVTLDKNSVVGFVTVLGSDNSHTAILARSMGIPAVVQVTGEDLPFPFLEGSEAVLDGASGRLYLCPDEETLKMAEQAIRREEQQRRQYRDLWGMANQTKSGRKIDLYANIAGVEDLGAVMASDAGGIGLMRSEFLYLSRTDFPSEEVQFFAYKQVLEGMMGKRVVIRTMDIGADKKIDYFDLPTEENPALGYRAIRISLDREEIFYTQLRALCRASMYGKLAILLPMIVSVGELRKAKAMILSVCEELQREGLFEPHPIEIGVMIETPAAAVMADVLAEEADFFSIGTNDLQQYTLAADRQNPKLESYEWLKDQEHVHPAVLRLIRYASDCAHQNGKWVGICGEMAADEQMTEWFLDVGIDELSVSPPLVLPLRAKIRQLP